MEHGILCLPVVTIHTTWQRVKHNLWNSFHIPNSDCVPKRRDELWGSRFSSVTDNVRLPKRTPNQAISLLPTEHARFHVGRTEYLCDTQAVSSPYRLIKAYFKTSLALTRHVCTCFNQDTNHHLIYALPVSHSFNVIRYRICRTGEARTNGPRIKFNIQTGSSVQPLVFTSQFLTMFWAQIKSNPKDLENMKFLLQFPLVVHKAESFAFQLAVTKIHGLRYIELQFCLFFVWVWNLVAQI